MIGIKDLQDKHLLPGEAELPAHLGPDDGAVDLEHDEISEDIVKDSSQEQDGQSGTQQNIGM